MTCLTSGRDESFLSTRLHHLSESGWVATKSRVTSSTLSFLIVSCLRIAVSVYVLQTSIMICCLHHGLYFCSLVRFVLQEVWQTSHRAQSLFFEAPFVVIPICSYILCGMRPAADEYSLNSQSVYICQRGSVESSKTEPEANIFYNLLNIYW